MPMPTEQRDALIARLWRASVGGERRELSDRALVMSALVAEVGLDPAVVLAYADGDAGKSAVRAQTEQAIARGAFGVPSIDVDGELLTGLRRLRPHRATPAGRRSVAGFDLSVWRDLPATAQRRT